MKYNRYAFTLLCGILLCCFSNRTLAQLYLSADPTTCGDSATTLHALLIGDVPTSSGVTADDGYSGSINIGFTFNFYGNNYTQLCIGSNGVLSMGTGSAGGYCTWPISNTLAGTVAGAAAMRNTFCGLWSDIYLFAGGTITYSTVGTAPYRKFMATWCATHMYSCTTQYETFQMIIYETTNICETHIAHRTTGCTWNGGYAIVGVANSTGTASTAAPGRDFPTLWGALNEAWRFSPTGSPTTAYAVTSIPFAPVPYASSTIYWYDSTTGLLVGSGPTITVSPSVPTTYKATAAGCSDSTIAFIHVLPTSGSGSVSGISAPVHITSLLGTDPTDCGKNDGTVRLVGVNPGFPDSIFYSVGGVPQPIIVQTSLADSSLTITGLLAGVYDYFYVKQGSCVSNAIPVTLYNPALAANFTYVTHPGCSGDSVIIINTGTTGGTYTYSTNPATTGVPLYPGPPSIYTSVFSYGDGFMDSSSVGASTYSPTHIYTTPGTYNINFFYHNNYGCSALATLPVTLGHPLTSVFTPSAPSVCLGVPVTFTNSSVGTGATYFWTFGDGVTSTDMNPNHSYAAPGTYNVTLTVTDFIPCTAVSNTNIDVISIGTRTDFHDTTVCLRLPLQIESYTEVVPSSLTNITYQWTPGTNLSDPTIPNPTFMGVGDYTYTLTATVLPLGCTASDVMTIHSKPPIILTHVTIDQVIPIGGSIQLNADSAWVYVWSPNDGTLSNANINNPIATPIDSVTTYMVVGMSPYGCRDSAFVTIRVDPTVTEFIPEAFTPNGDGLNDVFRVFNLGYYQKLVDFRIYNRWGHEVFNTINAKQGWDGTMNGVPQDMGVYYYQVIVSNPDGKQKSLKGSVTLIR